MNKKKFIIVTILFATVAMSGCFGSLNDSVDNSQNNPVVQPLGIDECYNCHDSMGLVSNDPVFWEWSASRHGNANNMPPMSFFGNTVTNCTPCHDPNGDSQNLTGYINSTSNPAPGSTPARNVIGCEACHIGVDPDPHMGANIQQPVRNIPDPMTCMVCHELVDDQGDVVVAHHDPTNPFGTLDEVITDTHFATAGSYPGSARGANQNPVTGYVMNFSETKVCRNCHAIHTFDKTRNLEWAQSAHADTTAAGAWAHYNWTEDGMSLRNDASDSSNRRSCQRCHTTSGVQAFMKANETGTAYSPPLAFDPNFKPEMLLCNGCHTDGRGALQQPGAITVQYTGVQPITYPDLDGSNICMVCHTGSESGEAISNRTGDFTNISFINSHYLAAGGTMFAVVGYEYDVDGDPGTNDYASLNIHSFIGVDDPLGTGIEGPCVGCHLTSQETHHLEPVDHAVSGTVTAITSTVCAECHNGVFTLDAAAVDGVRVGFEAALAVLYTELYNDGFLFFPAYPYFYNTPPPGPPSIWLTNWLSAGDTDTTGETTGKNNMGAAFNYNLLHHEPGAYVHNRLYTKRLIFDSIDWLDNNAIDGVIDLTSSSVAAVYLNASDPGNAVTRP